MQRRRIDPSSRLKLTGMLKAEKRFGEYSVVSILGGFWYRTKKRRVKIRNCIALMDTYSCTPTTDILSDDRVYVDI